MQWHIDSKYFTKVYKSTVQEPYPILIEGAALPCNNSYCFRKNTAVSV